MSTPKLISAAVAGPVMGEWFRIRSVVRANDVAIRDESRTLTYSQRNDRINQLSSGINWRGFLMMSDAWPHITAPHTSLLN